MSVTSINRKIARGFSKVGKKLGYQFSLYRADSYVTPLADRNRVMTIPLTWTPVRDEMFRFNPEPPLDYFILYCDYTVLQVGDILDQPTEGRTFMVYEINPIRGAVGVQCNRKMSVLRPIYTPTEDIKTSFEEIIVGLPCAFESIGAASNDGALSTVTSSMTAGQSQVEVWTVTKPDTIKLADVLEVNGGRYIITSIDTVLPGVKIKAKSTRAGK